MASEQQEKDETCFRELDKLLIDLDLDEEKVRQLKDQARHNGVHEIGKIMDDILNDYRKHAVDLAMTGQAGTGKSSLINTLRGLRPKEPGAASVATTECTMNPTPYDHPKVPNIKLWDLPGVNTPTFPKDQYIDQVNLSKFDGILLCSSTRFTEIDMWLAKEAQKRQMMFFFIRTKIDNDIQNSVDDGEENDEEQILASIRRDTKSQLDRQGLSTDRVFLICTKLKYQAQYDFSRLTQAIIDDTPPKNRTPLVLGMVACTEEFIAMKEEEMKKRIPGVALKAAASDEDHEQIIKDEIKNYTDWFGLSKAALQKWEVQAKRLDTKLAKIQEKLEEIRNEEVVECTAGRSIGKYFFGIGYLVGAVVDAGLTGQRQEDKEAKIRDAERTQSTQSAAAIQAAAELSLYDALSSCVELALGVMEERKKNTFMPQ